MKKSWLSSNWMPIAIIGFCLATFGSGFFTYFHQDDFIHLSYSQTLAQVINSFNIFHKGEFPFYRPIPTQLYFYLGKLVFSYNPFGYHLINFVIFAVNILLINLLFKRLIGKKEIGILGIIFYAINSTHFAPLNSPAYVHELLFVLFGTLMIIFFLKWAITKNIRFFILSLFFFILALMSKETAVILPGILFLIYMVFGKSRSVSELFKYFIPIIILLVLYLSAHFFLYGIAKGPSYKIIIGRQNINILTWYVLWSFSTPNILIDFIGPGLHVNPTFFKIAQLNGIVYSIFFALFIIALGICSLFFIMRNKIRGPKIKLVLMAIAWFIIGLIPLIIFPLHRLATEQSFSLIGLSLSVGVIIYDCIKQKSIVRYIAIATIVIYIVIALNSIQLAARTHWIIRSSQIAENTISYINRNYPSLSSDQMIYFTNGEIKIPEWGSSRQIYYALGNGLGLNLVLNKPFLRVYFEDINPPSEKDFALKQIIAIDSSKLLGY